MSLALVLTGFLIGSCLGSICTLAYYDVVSDLRWAMLGFSVLLLALIFIWYVGVGYRLYLKAVRCTCDEDEGCHLCDYEPSFFRFVFLHGFLKHGVMYVRSQK